MDRNGWRQYCETVDRRLTQILEQRAPHSGKVQPSTMPFYRFHVEATPLVVAERLKAIVRDRAGFWESFRMAWQSRDPSAPP